MDTNTSPPPPAPRTLCVAAIQMACTVNDFARNTARAAGWIAEAARAGAQLVLLPEMMPNGYTLTEAVWAGAEPLYGPTFVWLAELAVRHGLYLGTSFLEVDGEDFYDTFVLVDPLGRLAGRVRKNPPASFEAWLFRAGDDPHWFDTPLGRVGVGICFENSLYARYQELHAADVDLVLRPFSGASFQPRFPIRPQDVAMINAALRDGSGETGRLTGRPVVMANKVGRLACDLPWPFPRQDVEFPGYSTVADGDGTVLGQRGPGEEGVVLGVVHPDPARKVREQAPNLHGRWTVALPWWAPLWSLTGNLGARVYARSAARRAAARAVWARYGGGIR